MMIKSKSHSENRPCSIDYYYRPGKTMTDEQLKAFCAELELVAADCFLEIPRYQCLTGKRPELEQNVVTVARDHQGNPLGFCSAVILEMDGYKNVLHLGLTCVKKDARSLGLTHRLTSKLLMNYLIRTSLFRRIWVTNVACVLSSLGNIALYFEQVFPSPYSKVHPSEDHIRIAKVLDRTYRASVAINSDAVLDLENFVFRGSVENTVFQKSARDTRYYHRNMDLTDFYLNRLDFKSGDEVIQIARVGLFSYPKYFVKLSLLKLVKVTTTPIQRVKARLFSNRI